MINICFFCLANDIAMDLHEHVIEAKSYIFERLNTPAYCFKVVDGDTIKCVIKYNGEYLKVNVRLDGIDAPDINKDAKKTSTEFTKRFVENKYVNLQFISQDKYGRHLCTVYLLNENVNKKLIDGGYAIEYHGGTKIPQ
jgi:endonuclease YncB( thermonuclease family)